MPFVIACVFCGFALVIFVVARTMTPAAAPGGLHKCRSSSSADSWKGTQEKEEDPYASGSWGNNSWGRSPQASTAAPRQVRIPKPYTMPALLHVSVAAPLLCDAKHMICAHCIDCRC